MKKPFKKKITKPVPSSTIEENTNEPMRLNKFIAHSGVCSRRDADTLIAGGKVKVNGKVVVEVGTKVKLTDKVEYKGKTLRGEQPRYVLLNKPKDHITTTEDPKDRKTVMKLVGNACSERIYPVGRLDRNTTGLLLFTNDGDLAKKLSHPSYRIKKVYEVTLDKPLKEEHFLEIQKGITLDDGPVKVDDIAISVEDDRIIGVEIHLGRNRIVRRIFEYFGYNVDKLDRVVFAGLTKKDVPRGKWRHLNTKEVARLKMISSK